MNDVWISIVSKGEPPQPRFEHSLLATDKSIYVFGGTQAFTLLKSLFSEQTFFNDLYEFDIKNQQWKFIVTSGDKPERRSSHCAVLYDNKIVVFGGIVQGGKYCNNVFVLDLESKLWKLQETSGDKPSERYGHAGVLKDDKLYVIGGIGKMEYHNDVHELDLKTMKWTKIAATGEIPEKRGYHSAVVHGDFIYLCGGYQSSVFYEDLYQFDIKTGVWKKVLTQGKGPHVSNHSAVVNGNSMLVFGGNRYGAYTNELYEISFQDFKWKKIHAVGDIPRGRYGHACVIAQNSMYLFGGFDDSGRYRNDLHKFNFGPQHSLYLSRLLKNKLFSDAVFKVENEEFPVHRCVISQSKVLEEKINKASQDKSSEQVVEVQLDDVKPAIFEQVLKYLYCGTADIKNGESLVELARAAEIYQLEHLKNTCVAQFDRIVSQENLFQILTKAHKYQLQILKMLCLHYFSKFKQKSAQNMQLEEGLLIELLTFMRTSPKPKLPTIRQTNESDGLLRHLVRLYDTKIYSDITLIADDGKKVSAHRAILYALSSYFAALQSDAEEQVMHEVDGFTLKLMLEWIYKRHLKSLPNDIHLLKNSVAVLTKKQLLEDLLSLLVGKVLSLLTPENVMDIIHFCFQKNIGGKLIKGCRDYLHAHQNVLFIPLTERITIQGIELVKQQQKITEQRKALIQLQETIIKQNKKIKNLEESLERVIKHITGEEKYEKKKEEVKQESTKTEQKESPKEEEKKESTAEQEPTTEKESASEDAQQS